MIQALPVRAGADGPCDGVPLHADLVFVDPVESEQEEHYEDHDSQPRSDRPGLLKKLLYHVTFHGLR